MTACSRPRRSRARAGFTTDGSDPRTASSDATLYTVPIMLNGFTELRTATLAGATWSALVEATYLIDTVPADAANLVIAEFSYRPAAPDPAEDPSAIFDRGDFEFVELLNIGNATLDLSGVAFAAGIEFTFPPNATLAAGQRLLLVKNLAAFAARFGSTLPVGGEFAGSLSNDGEELVLRAADGADIRRFTFNDQPPWPTAADGEGYSLVLLQPQSNPDHTLPANWRSSAVLHGSPGATDTIPLADWMTTHGILDLTADDDGDGLNAFAEFATGSDPWVHTPAGDVLSITTVLAGDPADRYLEIAARRSLSAGNLVLTPEQSGDLAAWSDDPLAFTYLGERNHQDGTATVTWRTTSPVGDSARDFVRLRMESVE